MSALPHDAPLPPALLRLRWWFALPAGMVFVGGLLSTLMTKPPSAWGVIIPVACFAPIFVAIACVAAGQRRIRREVQRTHGASCIDCLRDLHDLPPRGRCPGCARSYDLESDRRSWIRAGLSLQPADARALPRR